MPPAPPTETWDGDEMTTAIDPQRPVSTGAELEVLLQCGRDILDGEDTPSQRSVDRTADWRRTLELARQHGMELLFLRWCRAGSFEGCPSDESRYDEKYDRLRRQNLGTIAHLVTLTERLDSAGVECLAYKGPAVSSRAYGSATVRRYADIDILISPTDQRRAKRLLEAEGYEVKQVNHAVFQSVLGHPDRQSPVDLHTHVVPDFFPLELPFEELYARRTRIDVGGRSVQGLSLSDAILVHSIHGAKHHWYRLEWILAVALLMQQHRDLASLLDRAETLGCERMVLLAMLLSQRLFDARFPERVQRMLDRESKSLRVVRTAADRVIHWLADTDWSNRNVKRTHLADFRFRSRLMSGRADKARFWAAALTNPRPEDEEAVPLPASLSPLYRVIRPFRLLYEYRGTLADRVLG